MSSPAPETLTAYVNGWNLSRRNEVASLLSAHATDVSTLVYSLCAAEITKLFEIFSREKVDYPWRLLYKERFPYLYGRIENIPMDSIRAWNRSVQDKELCPPGEHVYTFWDKVYSSTLKMWPNSSHMYLFDRFLNGAEEISSDDTETFAEQYPMLLLLCTAVSKAAKDLLVSIDSRDYIYVNWTREEKIAINEKSTTGRVILSLLLEDEEVPPTSRSLLNLAVKTKDVAFARLVLSNKRYMSHYLTRTDNGHPHIDEALYYAVHKGLTDMVALFLEDGRINPAYDNCTCLKEALSRRDDSMVQLLLSDQRVTSSPGYQKIVSLDNLITAIRGGDVSYVRTFVNHLSAEVCTTLLLEAARRHCVKAVEMLLADSSADPTAYAHQVLHMTTNTKIVELLICDGRADPQRGGSLVLQNMVNNYSVEGVRLLLEDGRADPGRLETLAWSSLTRDYRKQKYDILRMLVGDKRFNPAISGNYALRFMVDVEDEEIVKLLLADKRVDADLNDLLLSAVRCGRVESCKILLSDERIDPSHNKSKALRHAAKNGKSRITKLLLEDGRADPCAKIGKAFENAVSQHDWCIVGLFVTDGRIAELWRPYQ